MTKYKVQLSQYGLVASRADIEVEAKDESEANDIAVEMAQNGEVVFGVEIIKGGDVLDGWKYQTENIEESK